MTNVENACAGGSTAFHHAWLGVSSGLYDITMAVGSEKLYDPNKMKVFAGFLSGLDIENISEIIANISVYGMSEQDTKDMHEHVRKYAHLAKTGKKSKKKKATIKDKIQEYKDMFTVYIRLRDCVGPETVKEMRKLFTGDHSPFMDVNEIVVGTIAKVAVMKARTFINFGADWRRDFTAGIEGRVLRANPELAKTLSSLEGKRVEVRGWIQYRNGPYIDIEDPSQIAPVDETLPGRTSPPAGAMTSSDRDEQQAPEKEKRPAPKAPGALDL